MMNILNLINDYLGVILAILTTFLAIIESSKKITCKPLTWFMKKLRHVFVGDLTELISQIDKKIDNLSEKVDYNDIDVVKSRILGLDSLIRNKGNISMCQYKSFFKDVDKYRAYKRTYKTLNGELDNAIQNITNNYNRGNFC